MQCSQWKIFKNLSTNISDEEGKKLIIRVKMYEHLELFSDNEQRFSARGDIFIYSTYHVGHREMQWSFKECKT